MQTLQSNVEGMKKKKTERERERGIVYVQYTHLGQTMHRESITCNIKMFIIISFVGLSVCARFAFQYVYIALMKGLHSLGHGVVHLIRCTRLLKFCNICAFHKLIETKRFHLEDIFSVCE
jgi:hypothetical protein